MIDKAPVGNPLAVNVGSMIDHGPWGPVQKFVVALLALAYLVDGIANQSLGLAIPALTHALDLPREAFASVAAIGLVGLTIGAALGGVLGDRLGRRPMLVGSVLLFGAMTMAAGSAPSLSALFWLRFLDGLGMGAMIPNGAAMISETTPLRNRSMAIGLSMVFIAVGSMLAGVIASFLLVRYGWTTHFHVLGAIGVAAGLILLLMLPESPVFLARVRGNSERLAKTMCRFGHAMTADQPIVRTVPAGGERFTSMHVLFGDGVARSTWALWLAFFFCLLASYSVFSWVPAMLADLGYPLSMASLGMTANGAGGIVGGILSGYFIERFGSRRSILWSAVGGIASALLLGGMIAAGITSLALVFAALAVLGFFISNVHNGMYTLSAFLYPPHVRSTGVGAAAAVGRIGAIASSFVGVAALALGGGTGYFVVIAGSILVTLLGTAQITRHVPPVR